MGETVDVLVVAGNYGTGRRAGGVSTLICAVFDDRRTSEDDEPLCAQIPPHHGVFAAHRDLSLGTAPSCASAQGSRTRTTYGSARSPGRNGTRRTRRVSSRSRRRGQRIRVMSTWSPRSKFMQTSCGVWALTRDPSSFIVKVKAAEVTTTGE